MSVVDKFNGLNGAKVTRIEIESLIENASKEEQFLVENRLQSVLLSNPETEKFIFEIENPAIEVVPNSFLSCLDCEAEPIEESIGLAKAVSPNDIYQMITDRMESLIKEANSKDYKKTWNAKVYGKGYTIPFNFSSKKRYRGVNLFLLTDFKPLENPFFLTFKQVEEMKGTITKGAKGLPVVYFTQLFKVEDKIKNIDFGTYDYKKAVEFAKSKGISVDRISKIPILKYYNVFNGKDILGIDFDLENFKTGYIENELPAISENKMPIADAIIENYPLPAPAISHGGNRAFYRPAKDSIQMPHLADFDTSQDYYRTLFHELSHSTGDSARLNRNFSGKFGSKKYAFEELVAEWGAVFLSAEAGIIFHTNKNHAGYIKGWNAVLTQIKDDNRFIMRACTEAQKVADFVLQFDEENEPLYIKKLIKTIAIKPKKTTLKKAKQSPTVDKEKKEILITKFKEAGVIRRKNREALQKKEKNIKKSIDKVDENGQYALLGEKPKLAGVPVLEEPTEALKFTPEIVTSNPLVKSSQDLMNMSFDSLEFDGDWSNFMQEPAKNMKLAIWGAPKNGKTSGACALANYLTKFGNVLYNFADQGYNKSTQDIWKLSGLESNDKAYSTDVRELDDLEKLCASGDYQFVFIDMISNYIERTKIKPYEFADRFLKKYPTISFILIFEVTKGGNFKGDQGWTHLVDATITVENYLMENRGRYGVGEYVIWEDGFKKFNPKKYAEFQSQNSPEEGATELQPESQPQYSFVVS